MGKMQAPYRGRIMHILLAEDDRTSRELLRRILESEAHTVELATDGEEAWKLLQNPDHPFSVCLLDICMPAVSGMELVERMRGEERLRGIPVILCTALRDRETVRKAAGLGVKHFIIKPYSRTLMIEKLQEIGQTLESPSLVEETAFVCRRLGIDPATYREMVESLLADAAECAARLREPAAPAEQDKLVIRVRGIKGSCLSLGLPKLAEKFRRVTELFELERAKTSDPAPAAPAALLAEGLETELRKQTERLKVPA